MDTEAIKALSAKHPRPKDAHFVYGTAGFRMLATSLDSVVFRVGLLAALRSKAKGGQYIGVMITASHNAEPDNGVKLVEPLGEMLEQSWESYATQLANAATEDALVGALSMIKLTEGIDWSIPARIVVGRDTRPSGPALVDSVKNGIAALGGEIHDIGLVTTPQLHYVTRCLNTEGTPDAYGEPTVEGYYKKLAEAYVRIVKGKTPLTPLDVDAANGIGAPALEELSKHIGDQYLSVRVHNKTGKLNHECGADHVKLYQKKPEGLELKPGGRYASLDGDADRIVFYYVDDDNVFRLLDGDKIATLAAGFIMELIRKAQISLESGEPLKVGLVQTAYANGSSTNYVQNVLQVPVVFTPTGVKHLHHEAEHFDVGVYFEANGHGTVLFSKAAVKCFHAKDGVTEEEQSAIQTLRGLSDVINQAVGDALSDLLLVEAVLTCQGLTFPGWDQGYTDLPSRQEKVKVSNRHIFKPIKADTELAEPAGLQDKINFQVAKFKNGRCFVRPSGTEDIVRVYAEADTRDSTEQLANIVCGIVFDQYGGVGERPAKYHKVDEAGNLGPTIQKK
ncbi:hypothetical protein BJ742DRAFT_758695 [Cladochytrium replicatum]|nr:hypothetical protein BJ742DRAFT_758695 [Cladochytrium replicatum]